MGRSWVTRDADILIAEKACEYISDPRRRERPFFLYLTPNAPHEPCAEEFVPPVARGKSGAGARGALVWLFDWIVGRIMEALKRHGMADETLIIVTSDNGALPGDFTRDASGSRIVSDAANREFSFNTFGHDSCGGWRGYKSHIWEGGHREPLVARWPGRIPCGSVSEQTICLTDFMATCARVTGFNLPADSAEDSRDILDALTGVSTLAAAHRILIHHSAFGAFAVRHENWKRILHTDGSGGWVTPRDKPPREDRPCRLYDLFNDPAESHNLYHQRADVVEHLHALLANASNT